MAGGRRAGEYREHCTATGRGGRGERMKHVGWLVAVAVLAAAGSRGEPARESLGELKAKMEGVAAGFHGTLGYSLHFRGEPEERLDLRGDEAFPSASTIKVAVMGEALHQVEEGRLGWDEALTVPAGLEGRQEGGFAWYFRDGTALPI